MIYEAYLDIETTGLSWHYNEITVIGIYLVNGQESKVIQLVGDDISDVNLCRALENVSVIHTYNGSRFDLPFIQQALKVDLLSLIKHRDLMYDCWRCNLKGGLKSVEQRLGITRKLTGITGMDAVSLWWRYRNDYDEAALKTLLEYNREDVVNLKTLKDLFDSGL